jgi:hypothetical protein
MTKTRSKEPGMVPLGGLNALVDLVMPPDPKWGQIIQVLVGPEQVSCIAHKSILMKIPFFKTCL